MQYSPKVLEHFQNPRNNRELADADGVGKIYNPLDCGDMVKVYIKVADNKVEDITFQAAGCPAALASASIFTEMARGKSVDEILKITREDVANALGGLPENKINCSLLVCDAFKKAVRNFEKKQKGSLLKRVFKNRSGS